MAKKNRVSVIIPTLNEAGAIEGVINKIPKNHVDEILIVDGHSTDGTREVVKKLGYEAILQEGKGLGMGIKTALQRVTGDIIIVVDADGSHDPQDIPTMVKKINEGYDVVIASRYADGGRSYDDTPLRYIGNRMFTYFCKLLYNFKINDILMGFKAFRKEIFDKVEITVPGQEYDAQVLVRAHKQGFKLGEVPTVEHKRTYGVSKLRSTYHGWQILKVIIKERFTK